MASFQQQANDTFDVQNEMQCFESPDAPNTNSFMRSEIPLSVPSVFGNFALPKHLVALPHRTALMNAAPVRSGLIPHLAVLAQKPCWRARLRRRSLLPRHLLARKCLRQLQIGVGLVTSDLTRVWVGLVPRQSAFYKAWCRDQLVTTEYSNKIARFTNWDRSQTYMGVQVYLHMRESVNCTCILEVGKNLSNRRIWRNSKPLYSHDNGKGNGK